MANGALGRIVAGARNLRSFREEGVATQERADLAPLRRRQAEQVVETGDVELQKAQEGLRQSRHVNKLIEVASVPKGQRMPILQRQREELLAEGEDVSGLDRMIASDTDTRDALITQGIDFLQQQGLLKAPARREIQADVLGEKRFVDTGERTFPGVQAPGRVTPQQKFEQEQAKIELSRAQEKRIAGKLSSPAENALIEAQDAAQASDTAVSELLSIAGEFESLDPDAIKVGFAGKAREAFVSFLGTQDDLTRVRKRYNQIVNNQVMQNLPPGVASDKDIEIAFSGFLKDTADTKTTAAFLRGLAKIEQINGRFNAFKSDWISRKGNTRGMFKAWKEEINVDSRRDDSRVETRFNELISEGNTSEQAAATMAQEGF